MSVVFADTAYWIALVNPRDRLHQAARAATNEARITQLVTSEPVLTEFLNTFSSYGSFWRQTAVSVVGTIREDASIRVAPQTSALFQEGLVLYRNRLDKGYSLTDCMAMVEMRRRQISAILTADHHFTQEGFQTLIAPPA